MVASKTPVVIAVELIEISNSMVAELGLSKIAGYFQKMSMSLRSCQCFFDRLYKVKYDFTSITSYKVECILFSLK